MRGYIDVITRTTLHLQGGIDVEVKARNISPPNRKPCAAGAGYRTENSLPAVGLGALGRITGCDGRGSVLHACREPGTLSSSRCRLSISVNQG